MREYGSVWSSFWTGETGRALRGHPEAQLVALYLITGPTASWIGLYHVPVQLLAHHTGLTVEGASEGLRRAIEGGFCLYDESREEVFIPEMAAYQIGDTLDAKDKRHAAVVREWQKAKKSLFYSDFYRRYGKVYGLPRPSPIEGASKPHRSQEQEQEKEKKQEQEKDSPAGEPPGGGARGRDELFDAVAEVGGADPKVHGSRLGRVCKLLRQADPPYTPAEVRHLPAAIRARGLDFALTPEAVLKHIGWVRAPLAKPPHGRGAGRGRMAGFQELHPEIFDDRTADAAGLVQFPARVSPGGGAGP